MANYNENISQMGKYLFLEGCAHFHVTYSRTSLLCPCKTIIPKGERKKNNFRPCSLPSGTEMLSFTDRLPGISMCTATVFHLFL